MTISTATSTRRLDLATVRGVSQHAIHGRLRGAGPYGDTIYCATETALGVLLHINSGGNYLAAERGLRSEGYVVGDAYGPEAYCCAQPGCILLVTRRVLRRAATEEDLALMRRDVEDLRKEMERTAASDEGLDTL